MNKLSIGLIGLAAIVGCDAPRNVPLATPAAAPAQPSGIKYSRTYLGMDLINRDTMIVIEANGKRVVVLETCTPSGASRALTKISEEVITP